MDLRGVQRWFVWSALLTTWACSKRERAATHASSASARPALAASASATPRPSASATSATARALAFRSLAPGLSVFHDERPDADGRATEWLVARLELDLMRPRVRALPTLGFAELAADPRVAFGVNGGFFDPELRASGLLRSGGVELAPKRRGGGSGVLVVKDRRARLWQRDDTIPTGSDFAVQCGPRLIETGGGVGVHGDDGKRAARTAACIRESGRELDFVLAVTKDRPGDGPGLLELARTLSRPLAPGDDSGCDSALNLDGGPSTGITLRGAPASLREPLGPVPFAIVVTD